MRGRSHAVAGVLALLVTGACNSPDPRARGLPSSRISDVVDSIVENEIASGEVAGVTVAVMRGDRMVVNRGYGFADLARGIPASAGTVYRIGSLTKQFTAVAILKLAEQGAIDLDAPVASYLPQVQLEGPPISIRQLLTHTSGIRSYTDFDSTTNAAIRRSGTHDVLLELVARAGRDSRPGEWWHYNNSGYYLLGLVVEQAGHREFAAYLHDSVTSEAGLGATTECELDASTADLATGYVVARHRLVPVGPESLLPAFSAGGLCATAGDIARWQRELHAGNVLGKQAHAAMVTPAVLTDGTRTSYGFGLFIGRIGRHREYSHNGRIDGFASQAAYYPDDELSVVVVANTESPVAERLERRISSRILNVTSPSALQAARDVVDGGWVEGIYIDGPLTIPVWREHGHLVLRTPGGDTVLLVPKERNVFVQQDDSSTTYTFRTVAAERRRLEVRRNGMLYALAEIRP
jgi:D-alanyl-D-alanine carboxypeptidase